MAQRNNRFLIKRSNVAGKSPSNGDLFLGELALNTADVILYASGTTSNSILPIGWDRVSKTGDTINGNLTITGNTNISGSTNISGDLSAKTLVSTQSIGDEGGQINLYTSQTGNSLSGGSVTLDIFQNRFRIFETGSPNRGVYIDLTAAASSVGTNLLSGGGGEINTASNLGSGTGLFAQKVAADLQFKSLTSTGGTVTISNDSTTVNLEANVSSTFTGGTVNGATNFTNGVTANTLSATSITSTTYSFDTAYTGATPYGTMSWNTDFGVPQIGMIGGNVIQKVGESVYAYVKNVDTTPLTRGEVVYIFGAVGDKISVKRASSVADTFSSKTLGVVAESIDVNADGYVITQGTLDGLNLGAYNEGDILWLSQTPGQFTKIKEYAPNHLVFIGVVQRANNGDGQMYVKPQNGYELEELHDVATTGATFGDLIIYSAKSGTNLWVNSKTLPGSYTITGNTTVGGTMEAATVSATTYQNLPTDIRVTGGTYSNNNFTFTNNTGGTFSINNVNTMTGLTVNGTILATTISATTYQNISLQFFREIQNTSSPNATTPVNALTAVTSGSDADFAIIPKGNGAILADIPDGTVAGGNKRGQFAVDLQLGRLVNTEVASGNYSVISGGYRNKATAQDSSVGGGVDNAASGTQSRVGGGQSNSASSDFSTVGGGANNTASGSRTIVAGGASCTATAYAASTLGGFGNTSTNSYSSNLGGQSNSSSGSYSSVIGGANNTASGNYSIAGGGGSVANSLGSVALGLGANVNGVVYRNSFGANITVAGDAQKSTFIMRMRTTDNTLTDFTSEGTAAATNNQLVLNNNSSYRFKGTIIAKQQSGSTNTAAWDIDGLIVRGANAASISLLIGNVVVVQNTPAWGTPILSTNTTSGSLRIRIQGAPSTNIQWVANIETTEVIY